MFVVPLTVVFGLLHGALWLRWRGHTSLWWMASDWLGAGAVILILLRGILPAWITFPFAQTAIIASSLLLWQGFRCMTCRPLPLRAFAVVTLVYFGIFYILRSSVEDIGFFLVFAYLALFAVNAGVAIDLARAPLASQRFAYRLLALMFLCHALFYLFHSAISFLAKPSAVFLDMTGLQSVTILVVLFTASFWNLGALWLTVQQHRPLAMTQVDA